MSTYQGRSDYTHDQLNRVGILITNLGTPDAPTTSALRRYLAEFLADPRVVEFPRLLWWFILHGIILRFRPARSAKVYQKIWTANGSPLLHYSKQQAVALQTLLNTSHGDSVKVELAMRYGNPSIREGLEKLREANVDRLLILPLYPQYSATTTASTFDAVAKVLNQWRWLPSVRFINTYHDFQPYINAMATHIKKHWQLEKRSEKLLFSFHGIPKRYLLQGDPYYCYCHKTARLLAKELELSEEQWQVVFQSRFGREEWLKPYADHTLQALPDTGIRTVDVFCPGFSVDCLETLEEIAMENKELFLQAGGESFQYIAALNDCEEHIKALQQLIAKELQGWNLAAISEVDQQTKKQQALKQGAQA